MSYKSKYIHYKVKYLNLKNYFTYQTQMGGAEEEKTEKSQETATSQEITTSQGSNSNSDSFAEYEIDKDALSSERNKKEQEELEKHKTDPGRGLIGDALYYWVVNTGIDKRLEKEEKSNKWKYQEPEIEVVQPDIVPYTEFDQETISKIYNHSRSEYDEGFDIGYIVGYECGCNQNKNPEKKEAPGNISVPEFLNGYNDGWNLGFYKGTKYYYTTWIQVNNNNINYKKNLLNYVATGQDKEINDDNYLKDKSDPNYDEIEERSYNEYYVYLKKKLIGKTHWFL